MTDDMRPIGSGLERLLRDIGMPRIFDIGRLADEWPEVAGEPFAALSQPASYRGENWSFRLPTGPVPASSSSMLEASSNASQSAMDRVW